MNDLRALLDTRLNVNDGHALAGQLVACDSWQSRVSLLHREAEQKLSEMKGKFFDPSLSSEDKRKINLEYKVRDFQRVASELADLADILKRRISLGQTLIKNLSKELESGVML